MVLRLKGGDICSMAEKKRKFEFDGKLSSIDGVFLKTAIFLPEAIIRKLPAGRVRVKGLCNNAPFALAVLHLKDGARYFAVSAHLRKAAGIAVGDHVNVRFTIVDPDKLDMPEELEAVLAQDDDARTAWDRFTTGYQRSLIHYITSVKNVDSRIKRSLELLDRAKRGDLHGQQKRGKDKK